MAVGKPYAPAYPFHKNCHPAILHHKDDKKISSVTAQVGVKFSIGRVHSAEKEVIRDNQKWLTIDSLQTKEHATKS